MNMISDIQWCCLIFDSDYRILPIVDSASGVHELDFPSSSARIVAMRMSRNARNRRNTVFRFERARSRFPRKLSTLLDLATARVVSPAHVRRFRIAKLDEVAIKLTRLYRWPLRARETRIATMAAAASVARRWRCAHARWRREVGRGSAKPESENSKQQLLM